MKRKEMISILTILFFTFLVLSILYVPLHPMKFGITKEKIIEISPYFFLSDFVLILLFLILSIRDIVSYFLSTRKEIIICLVLILLVGFCIREFIVPHTHRVFFDEDLYLGVANSIASEFRNILCNYGTPTHCIEGILNKDPSGFPFLVAILFKFFGRSEAMVFQFSVLIGTLTILLIFLLASLLFKDNRAGLISSFLFAILPVHIVWCGSVATEIYFTFFSVFSIAMLLFFFRKRKRKYRLLFLSTSLLAFAVQIRPEGILFVLIFFIFFLFFEKNLKKALTSPKIWLGVVLLVVLLFSHISQLSLFKHESWGAPSGKKFGLNYLKLNIIDNLLFFVKGDMNPALLTILAFIGFMLIFIKDKRIAVPLLLWFGIYFILFALFYAGSVYSGGIGTRFVNIYIAPYIMFAGYGINFIISRSKRIGSILLLLLLASLYFTIPFITIPDKQAQYARDMHDFVMAHMKEIDSSCWVLTHNPSIFLVAGKNSLQTWFGSNRKVMEEIFNESDCVLWLEGAWCLFEPHRSGVCKNMHSNYRLEIFARLVRDENPNQVFTIYKVHKK